MTTPNSAPQSDGPGTATSPYEPTILCDALFASSLQSSQHPSAGDVRAAINNTLSTLDAAQCVARVAQEFGDHPETAIIRMHWAIDAVALAYGHVAASSPPSQAARRPQARAPMTGVPARPA